jgi:hypothetical protein
VSDVSGKVKAFLETLDKLPPFTGVTWRGCSADAEFVRPGQSVVTRGLVATSRQIDVATEGRTAPALYAIGSLNGRDITAFSSRRDEHEIVFLPGTLFHLAETRTLAGVVVHLVFELDLSHGRPQLPAEAVDRLAHAVETFLTERGPEPRSEFSSIPGKFAGDID